MIRKLVLVAVVTLLCLAVLVDRLSLMNGLCERR
jgi:hypothetical protein